MLLQKLGVLPIITATTTQPVAAAAAALVSMTTSTTTTTTSSALGQSFAEPLDLDASGTFVVVGIVRSHCESLTVFFVVCSDHCRQCGRL